jgi:hypothetical protein
MDLIGRPASGSEEPRTQAGGDELVERVARAVREDGTVETLEGLYLARSSSPTELGHGGRRPRGTPDSKRNGRGSRPRR